MELEPYKQRITDPQRGSATLRALQVSSQLSRPNAYSPNSFHAAALQRCHLTSQWRAFYAFEIAKLTSFKHSAVTENMTYTDCCQQRSWSASIEVCLTSVTYVVPPSAVSTITTSRPRNGAGMSRPTHFRRAYCGISSGEYYWRLAAACWRYADEGDTLRELNEHNAMRRRCRRGLVSGTQNGIRPWSSYWLASILPPQSSPSHGILLYCGKKVTSTRTVARFYVEYHRTTTVNNHWSTLDGVHYNYEQWWESKINNK